MNSFMPTGRTALVKSGDSHLQVQTEYAYRPYPRITTTISNNGQVIHKLEKKLDRPVDNAEEQTKIETFIKKQHHVVLDTIKESSTSNPEQKPSQTILAETKPETVQPVTVEDLSITEKISASPGFQFLFHLDKLGNFMNTGGDASFRKQFPKVYKSLKDLLEIFPINAIGVREAGVCEIDRDRLYLISCGEDLYFVSVRRTDGETIYEKYFKRLIASPEELLFQQ